MTSTADRLVAGYLKRLNAELRGVPRARRKEIVADIAEHIAEARASLPDESEAEIRALLDRVGDPAEIAAAERPPPAAGESAWREPAAVALLLLGGFVFLAGWIVGVVLLWASERWTTRDKLIGTLVMPFGLVFPIFLFSSTLGSSSGSSTNCSHVSGGTDHCVTTSSGGTSGTVQLLATIVGIGVLVAPLATTVYLSMRLRTRRHVPAVT